MNLHDKIKLLPKSPGVYIMRDSCGTIIYIGKAKNLHLRVGSYFNKSKKTAKTQALVTKVAALEYILTLSESDALALECNLVKKHMPFFNILLKDGKQFAFIKLDVKQRYPKFMITRKIKKDGAKYFGPYINGANAGGVMEILKTAFLLRTCNTDFSKTKKARRACLNFHLEKCLAPCINNCEEEYDKQLKEACSFLNGKTSTVSEILNAKMQKLSEAEAFEEALVIRNRIKMLDRIKERVYAIGKRLADMDCFAVCGNELLTVVTMAVVRDGRIVAMNNFFVQNFERSGFASFLAQIYFTQGINTKTILTAFETDDSEAFAAIIKNNFGVDVRIKKATTTEEKGVLRHAEKNAEECLAQHFDAKRQAQAAMQELKKALGLRTLPQRIECYDISNTSGTNSVGGMVVFSGGEKDKTQYRKFKIKTVKGANDFDSLAEVITRRFNAMQQKTNAGFEKMPDLIVIDGGKGQLSSVVKAAEKFECAKNIDFIGLAERNEEVFVQDKSKPVILNKDSMALKLLINVRDETHRFSINYHTKLRTKNMLK